MIGDDDFTTTPPSTRPPVYWDAVERHMRELNAQMRLELNQQLFADGEAKPHVDYKAPSRWQRLKWSVGAYCSHLWAALWNDCNRQCDHDDY